MNLKLNLIIIAVLSTFCVFQAFVLLDVKKDNAELTKNLNKHINETSALSTTNKHRIDNLLNIIIAHHPD